METIQINNWHEMKYHTLCLIFPPMNDDEYDSLVKSMREMGYDESEPITVIQDPEDEFRYLVLDGRNRHMAAQDAGVEPTFIEHIDIKDLVQYVTAKNIARRELTAGQKASIASKLATYDVGSNQFTKGTTLKEAAEMTGASITSIKKLNKLKNDDPKLAEQVEIGEISLNDAVNRTRIEEEEIPEKESVKEDEINLDPKYLLLEEIYNKYTDRSMTSTTMREMIVETIEKATKL